MEPFRTHTPIHTEGDVVEEPEEKKVAAKRIASSGLRLGIINTITSLNICDIDSILEYCLKLAPALSFVVFNVASPRGRYELSVDTVVDRESVIKKLMSSKALGGVGSLDCFWPIPSFRPWGMEAHPDCSAIIYLLVNKRRNYPIDTIMNVDGFYKRLDNNAMNPNFFTMNIVPLYYAIRESKLSQIPKLLVYFFGALTGLGSSGMVPIAVDSFLGIDYQDEQRLARCANSHITEKGPISPCEYYYPETASSLFEKK